MGIDIKKNIELENIIYANDINQEGPCHLKISNYTEYFKGKYSQKDTEICLDTHLKRLNKLNEILQNYLRNILVRKIKLL